MWRGVVPPVLGRRRWAAACEEPGRAVPRAHPACGLGMRCGLPRAGGAGPAPGAVQGGTGGWGGRGEREAAAVQSVTGLCGT